MMRRPTEVLGPQPTAVTRREDADILAGGPLAIVGGCGHVGLPLGLAFAAKGFQVDLVDTCAERVDLVNQGRMPFHEDDADPLLGRLVQAGLVK
ncbi:MAG: hypothetical protein JO112_06130, partial [Planctomycetes bacterium]|nr:hypothetical protein [Planctomycetota bacterium]